MSLKFQFTEKISWADYETKQMKAWLKEQLHSGLIEVVETSETTTDKTFYRIKGEELLWVFDERPDPERRPYSSAFVPTHYSGVEFEQLKFVSQYEYGGFLNWIEMELRTGKIIEFAAAELGFIPSIPEQNQYRFFGIRDEAQIWVLMPDKSDYGEFQPYNLDGLSSHRVDEKVKPTSSILEKAGLGDKNWCLSRLKDFWIKLRT